MVFFCYTCFPYPVIDLIFPWLAGFLVVFINFSHIVHVRCMKSISYFGHFEFLRFYFLNEKLAKFKQSKKYESPKVDSRRIIQGLKMNIGLPLLLRSIPEH
jgi:hypothetical protein